MCRLLMTVLLVALAPALSAQKLPSWAEAPSHSDSYYAAEDPADDGGCTPPCLPDDPDPVPVDGGLALLALAGGAYAVRRLRRHA